MKPYQFDVAVSTLSPKPKCRSQEKLFVSTLSGVPLETLSAVSAYLSQELLGLDLGSDLFFYFLQDGGQLTDLALKLGPLYHRGFLV